MFCEECKKRKAVINFTQIVDNKVTTSHLCESCAEKKGVGNKGALPDSPLNNFISQIGSQISENKEEGVLKTCEACGATLHELQKTGKLGCPQCYFSFEQEIGNFLRRIQGSQVHVGRGMRNRALKMTGKENRLIELRRLLEESVQKEEYERAAMLRDEIRVLEERGSGVDADGGEDSGPFSTI